MKKVSIITLVALVALTLAGLTVAGDAKDSGEVVTLEGKIVCAKCALHEEGREKCQNVLVVEAKDEAEHYYLDDTAANDDMGYVCTSTKTVKVTGTVTEKDGHMWLAAKEIVSSEDES